MNFSRPFSASAFNAAVAWLRRNFPLAGKNAHLEYTPQGIRVHALTTSTWQHPWELRCFTAPKKDGSLQWRAEVHPGFVNGRDVAIVTDGVPQFLTDDPRPSLDLSGPWNNPLASQGLATEGDTLTALPGRDYPPFFATIGVAGRAPGGDATRDTSLNSPPDPARTRQLRSLDIVLVVPRPAAVQQTSFVGPYGTDLSIDTHYVNDYVRATAAPYLLHVRQQWQPPQQPSALDTLNGSAVDPQTDELKLCTLWMVSPPDGDPEGQPDGTWTPYPQYTAFWNLNHASLNQPAAAAQPPITLTTGLLGGTADAIFAALLSPVNAGYASTQTFLSSAKLEGQFFT